MQITDNWVKNPTKKTLLIVFGFWLLSSLGLLLSMTNFLSENPFQGRYFMLWLLIAGASTASFMVYRNYRANNLP